VAEPAHAAGFAGIRSVIIEGDLGEHLPHQTVTRIEAFMETLA